MKISDFVRTKKSGLVRLEARIEWEDSDRKPFNLSFETPEHFESDVLAHSSTLLNACLFPAWRDGEKRVAIEASLCPVFTRQIEIAMTVLRQWYPALGEYPTIESDKGYRAFSPRGNRALSLMSCGVDSLAVLRWNKRNIPDEHPDAISGILMMLLTDDPDGNSQPIESLQTGRQQAAAEVAADVGATFIPVASNLWWLVDDVHFYDKVWFGAVLASIAHILAGGYRLGYVAAGRGVSDLYPCGSHPLIDPNLSSAHFRIALDGVEQTRLAKTALIADWPVGLDNLRVCQNDPDGLGNCGTCEKCIRTKMALVALEKLESCNVFQEPDVDLHLLDTMNEYNMITSRYIADCYRELIPTLMRIGRDDLATGLKKVLDAATVSDPYKNVEIGLPRRQLDSDTPAAKWRA